MFLVFHHLSKMWSMIRRPTSICEAKRSNRKDRFLSATWNSCRNHVTYSSDNKRKLKSSCIEVYAIKKKSIRTKQLSSLQVSFFWHSSEATGSFFVALFETIIYSCRNSDLYSGRIFISKVILQHKTYREAPSHRIPQGQFTRAKSEMSSGCTSLGSRRVQWSPEFKQKLFQWNATLTVRKRAEWEDWHIAKFEKYLGYSHASKIGFCNCCSVCTSFAGCWWSLCTTASPQNGIFGPSFPSIFFAQCQSLGTFYLSCLKTIASYLHVAAIFVLPFVGKARTCLTKELHWIIFVCKGLGVTILKEGCLRDKARCVNFSTRLPVSMDTSFNHLDSFSLDWRKYYILWKMDLVEMSYLTQLLALVISKFSSLIMNRRARSLIFIAGEQHKALLAT